MHFAIVMLIAFSMSACVGKAHADEKTKQLEPVKINEFLGDVNLFSQSYVKSKPLNAKSIVSTEAPKLLSGKDQVLDYQRMQELGFALLGYSNFKAGHVPPEEALNQAKKLNAHTVLLYTEKMAGTPATVRLQNIREAQKTGKPEPVNSQTYSYFASYWAKLLPPVFGVHVKVPEKDDTDPGLSVMVVIEGSPAEKAGLIKEDVLLKIGDLELNKVEALSEAVKQYAGQTVKVIYTRNRQWSEAEVNLNK
jgi:hypothetical protein